MNEINTKKLLFEAADVLEDIGVEFFLFDGTFLGAVRENRFIKIDRDIDLAMLHENFLPVAKDVGNRLIKKGIKIEIIDHRHEKPWDGSIYAIKFYGYGEHGDLVGYAKIKGKRAVPSHVGDFWRVHTARFLEELSEIEFYGRIFKVPKNADSLLTEEYGDWRTPHKEFYNISKCRKSESWIENIKGGLNAFRMV